MQDACTLPILYCISPTWEGSGLCVLLQWWRSHCLRWDHICQPHGPKKKLDLWEWVSPSVIECILCTLLVDPCVADPFGLIGAYDVEYDMLRDPSEGFLSEGEVVVVMDVKEVRVTTEWMHIAQGDDTRRINIMAFGRPSISRRLMQGRVFGIASETKIRSNNVRANLVSRRVAVCVTTLLCLHHIRLLFLFRTYACASGCVNDLWMARCS